VEVQKRGCKEYNLEMISLIVAELGSELDFRSVERPTDVEYLIKSVHRFERIRKLRVRLVSDHVVELISKCKALKGLEVVNADGAIDHLPRLVEVINAGLPGLLDLTLTRLPLSAFLTLRPIPSLDFTPAASDPPTLSLLLSLIPLASSTLKLTNLFHSEAQSGTAYNQERPPCLMMVG
jgi:hypothetical protein